MAGLSAKQQVFVEAFVGKARFNATEAARIAKYAYPNVEGPKNLVKPSIAEAIRARIAEVVMTPEQVMVELRDQATADMSDFLSFQQVYESVPIKKPVREILDELLARIQFEQQFAARANLADAALTDHNASIASMQREALRLEMKLEWDAHAVQDATMSVPRWEARLDLKKAEEAGKLHLLHSYNADTGRIELVSSQKALELIGKHFALFIDKVEHGGSIEATITSEEMAKARQIARDWERQHFGKAAS